MFKSIIIVIFLSIAIYANKITLLLNENNVTLYQNMLSKLNESNTTNNLQASLQIALLKRLIAIELSHIPMSSDAIAQLLKAEPQTVDDLRQFIEGVIEGEIHKENLYKEIQKRESDKKELGKVLEKDINSTSEKIITLKLQYIYNNKELQRAKKRYKAVIEAFKGIPNIFIKASHSIKIDRWYITKELIKNHVKVQSLLKEHHDLQLEKERLDILGYSGNEMNSVIQKLSKINKELKNLKKRKLEDIAILYAYDIKLKSDEAFTRQKNIITMLHKLQYPSYLIKDMNELFLKINTKVFGIISIIERAINEEIEHSLNLFWNKINTPIFSIGETNLSILKIVGAITILILGYLIGWLYKRSITNINSHNLTTATRTLLSNMGYYLIIIISFFSMLHYLGIRLTSIAIVAGALSVGIGFGLQNIVSNFVSGIILMFERSIKIGDYIEMEDGLSGYVSDIRMRSVTITTNSNIDIIVPNQQLIQNRVVNWTMHDKIRRFEIPFGVAYGTKVEDVVRVVLEAVGRSGFQDIYISNDRKTQVIMTDMGDSGVNFKLLVWIKGNKTLWPQRTMSRFLILIYSALNEANIEIPFPQRDLHIRSIDTDIPIIIKDKKRNNR